MSTEFPVPTGYVVIRMRTGKDAKFEADTVIDDDERSSYIFKKGGQVVGEYTKDEVAGWHAGNRPAVASVGSRGRRR